jgi:malate synthase
LTNLTGFDQYHVRREEVKVAAADLLNTKVPGKITEEGVQSNVATALAYTAAWIGGNGCIPLNYLMEDAATAEITRVQLWQWVKYGSRMDNGQIITAEYIDGIINAQKGGIKKLAPGINEKDLAVTVEYLKKQIRKEWPSEFLTSDLMPHLAVKDGAPAKWQKSVL